VGCLNKVMNHRILLPHSLCGCEYWFRVKGRTLIEGVLASRGYVPSILQMYS
jgi:hypothetical protein